MSIDSFFSTISSKLHNDYISFHSFNTEADTIDCLGVYRRDRIKSDKYRTAHVLFHRGGNAIFAWTESIMTRDQENMTLNRDSLDLECWNVVDKLQELLLIRLAKIILYF